MSAVSLGEVADQLSRDLAKQRSVLITGPLAPFAVVWFLVEAAGAETSQAVRHVQRKLPSFQPTTEQTILLGYLEKSRQNPSHRVEIDAFVQSNNGIYINEPLSWEDHILRMQEETQDEFATVASTLHKLFSNIVNTPTDQRYRRLRQSNKRIAALIQWRTVREYLLQCGWQPQPDELVFVSADLQSLRDGILRFSASVYI
ncbi:MAG: hypothetical protein KVP17_000202 [Porospora cf. gigantea B]|uniref:uncharacterized protein n=1 Tax=Porospora cf. gigantea B TaxID=2853592 RepID=UPI003571E162|nr:MAG: hypothetical protein KVP17_000202 [Porospora cf. gigantea B]